MLTPWAIRSKRLCGKWKVSKLLSPEMLVCILHLPLTSFGNLDSLSPSCFLKIWIARTKCGLPLPNNLREMTDYRSERFVKKPWGHHTLMSTAVWQVAPCSTRSGVTGVAERLWRVLTVLSASPHLAWGYFWLS